MNVPGFTCCRCGTPVAHQITRATPDGLRCIDGRACVGRATAARHRRLAAERIEDLRWMADGGECLVGAAARLGMSVGAVTVLLRRHNELELREVLSRRNPRDWNTQADGSNVMALGGDPTYLERKRKERAKGRPSRRQVAA